MSSSSEEDEDINHNELPFLTQVSAKSTEPTSTQATEQSTDKELPFLTQMSAKSDSDTDTVPTEISNNNSTVNPNIYCPREATMLEFDKTPPTQDGNSDENYMRYAAIVPYGEGKWQLYEDHLAVHVDEQKAWWPDYYKVTLHLCKFMDWEDGLGLEEPSEKEFRLKSRYFLRYALEMMEKWGDHCIPQDIRVFYNWLKARRNEEKRTFRKSLGFAKFEEDFSYNEFTFTKSKGIIIDYRFPFLHVDYVENIRAGKKRKFSSSK